MNFKIKLFSFKGIPVYIKPLFLLLFVFLKIPLVISIFIAVLLHELAHAWFAKHYNLPVESIWIDILNGAADIDLKNATPGQSIGVVIAGPLINLLFFFLSLLAYAKFGHEYFRTFSWVNLNLFVFNILPIFPLDGGRITRDIITLVTKNKQKSVVIGSYLSIITSVIVAYYFFLQHEWIIVVVMSFFVLVNVLLLTDKD